MLIDPAPDRKRLAVLACCRGGQVAALDGGVQLTAVIWFEASPARSGPHASRRIEVAEIEHALRGRLGRGDELAIEIPDYLTYRNAPEIMVTTDAPRTAIAALAEAARELGARLDLWAAVSDPIGAAVRRLVDDVRD